MTGKVSSETEDRIVQYIEEHPGVTAWAIGTLRSMGMSMASAAICANAVSSPCPTPDEPI